MKNAHVTATLDIEKGPRQHYPLQCGIGISRDCSRSFVQMPWGRQEISIMLLKMQKPLFVESLSIEQNASTYRAVASLKNKLHIMEQTIKRFPNSPACALPLITLHKPGGKKCIPVEIESKKKKAEQLDSHFRVLHPFSFLFTSQNQLHGWIKEMCTYRLKSL